MICIRDNKQVKEWLIALHQGYSVNSRATEGFGSLDWQFKRNRLALVVRLDKLASLGSYTCTVVLPVLSDT